MVKATLFHEGRVLAELDPRKNYAIGRAGDIVVPASNDLVSRVHGIFKPQYMGVLGGPLWVYEDLSTNGTVIKQEPREYGLGDGGIIARLHRGEESQIFTKGRSSTERRTTDDPSFLLERDAVLYLAGDLESRSLHFGWTAQAKRGLGVAIELKYS